MSNMSGGEFLRFIDLILKCETGARIREANAENRYTVDSVLAIANCIQTREYEGVQVLSEIGKNRGRYSRSPVSLCPTRS